MAMMRRVGGKIIGVNSVLPIVDSTKQMQLKKLSKKIDDEEEGNFLIPKQKKNTEEKIEDDDV